MQIKIQQAMSIHDFQAAFQQYFPFLKIEFYEKMHQVGEASPQKNQYNHQMTFGEIQPALPDGVLTISPDITVLELENILETTYGLSAQLFRKSGSVWLQTIRTDNWTLQALNDEAEKTHTRITDIEPEDYHEQE